MTTGQKIKKIRKQLKLTQEEFAKLLSVSSSLVSAYERDERLLSIDLAKQICKAFNTSLDWLYGTEKSEHENTSTKIQISVWCPKCKEYHVLKCTVDPLSVRPKRKG